MMDGAQRISRHEVLASAYTGVNVLLHNSAETGHLSRAQPNQVALIKGSGAHW